MSPVRISHPSLTIDVVDEPTYSMGSADNVRTYDCEHDLSGRGAAISTHGVAVSHEGGGRAVVVAASGGATGVHERSAVAANDRLFLAVSDQLVCFSLPALELKWTRQADPATVFGVWWSEPHQCLVSHGELEIARWSIEGDRAWSVSGEDIFSEGFEVAGSAVRATDFNGRRYCWSIQSGAAERASEP